MKTSCMQCKSEVDAPDPAPPQIVNLPNVSMVLIEHPNQTVCPGCGATVTLCVVQTQNALGAVPVPPKEQKPVILSPGGMRLN